MGSYMLLCFSFTKMNSYDKMGTMQRTDRGIVNTKKTHVLITGSNRSGTTWAGRVVDANVHVDKITEPLNLNRIKRFGRIHLDFWYPKVDKSSPAPLQNELKKLFSEYLGASYKTFFTQMFEKYEGHNLLQSSRKRLDRATKPIKLLKDPTALFCIPWLVEEFEVRPVILIRHPAAYALSIKEKNWWFDFDNFLMQPDFFKGAMAHLKPEVVAFQANADKKTIMENAALLWKVFYTQVSLYQREHPNWFYITHEELSIDPYVQFEKMFDYMGIDFSAKVKAYILESTQATAKEEYKRDAVANSIKWKNRLTNTEKETVYSITKEVSDSYYDSWS